MPKTKQLNAEKLAQHDASVQLRKGTLVRNIASGRNYRVGELLGVGGMGAVYHVTQEGGSPIAIPYCLKVTVDQECWHSEAYFGSLLKDVEGVIKVIETFAWMPARKDAVPVYCLVSEFAESGDLAHYLNRVGKPWKEQVARKQIIQLARTVQLLHDAGAVHRDITPANVFVTSSGQLKLGDFGIASHRVGNRAIRVDALNPAFAQTAHLERRVRSWKPTDDVFHLGQLYAFLLQGNVDRKLTAKEIKQLECSAEAKSVIQRSVGSRQKRLPDAAAMLALLQQQEKKQSRNAPVLKSLRGLNVVFTGGLATMTRAEAARLLKKTGANMQPRVNDDTDVVVVGGQSPNWIADKKGRKLLDVDRERERGHIIDVLEERRFRALTRQSTAK